MSSNVYRPGPPPVSIKRHYLGKFEPPIRSIEPSPLVFYLIIVISADDFTPSENTVGGIDQ